MPEHTHIPTETLGLVFGLDEPSKSDRRIDAEDASRLRAAIGSIVATGLPPQHVPGAAAEVLAMLRTALAKSVGTILTDAWNQRQEFRKYTDRASYPPEVTSRVTLKPHTVKWTYRPSIQLLLDGRPVRKLSFVVELALKLLGVQVAIRDGRFVRVHTGRSQVTATLRCGDVELCKRSSREYELPGELPLGDGIRITSLAAPFSFGTPAPAPVPPAAR